MNRYRPHKPMRELLQKLAREGIELEQLDSSAKGGHAWLHLAKDGKRIVHGVSAHSKVSKNFLANNLTTIRRRFREQ